MKNLNLRSICLLLAIIFHLNSFGQEVSYPAFTIPEELTKNANQVFRLDYMKFSVNSTKDIQEHVKKVVTVLNGSSSETTQWVAYDKDSKITFLKAKIFDQFGREVRELKKSDFSDNSAISRGTMYSDSRYKKAELHYNTYPYTIEFEYKKSYKSIMHYPSFQFGGFYTGAEKVEFRVEMPHDIELRYKSFKMDFEPEILKTKDKTIYSWIAENLPPIQWEEMMPGHAEIVPRIKLAPSVFHFDGYDGDFSTWESYGRFFYDINQSQTELSPEMYRKVLQLTDGLATNQEKVAVLYRYLQENTRYVSVQLGIGGYQAFDAQYVEKNQYGDCKALSNFMLSMLKSIGIRAYHVVIYRDPYKKFEVDEDFAAYFGNHMIVYLPEEDIWLECTSSDYPVNYLGVTNDDRPVMLLTEEGGKLARSPAYDINENTHQSTATIEISEKGSAAIKSSTRFYGPQHDFYRYAANNFTEKEQEEWFLKNNALTAFKIEKLEFSSAREVPEAQLSFEIFVGRYASKAGKRIFLPINKLNVHDNVPPPTENRLYPIEVIRSYSESDEYNFILPEGYKVESMPESEIDLQTDYGKYQVKITVEGTTLKYQRKLEIYQSELPPEQYEAFRDFHKAIAKADAMKVVLVKKKT